MGKRRKPRTEMTQQIFNLVKALTENNLSVNKISKALDIGLTTVYKIRAAEYDLDKYRIQQKETKPIPETKDSLDEFIDELQSLVNRYKRKSESNGFKRVSNEELEYLAENNPDDGSWVGR